jgi:hypothetical protein
VEDKIRPFAGQRLAQRCAVFEFDGVDPSAVHDERQEMPNARLFIDQKT